MSNSIDYLDESSVVYADFFKPIRETFEGQGTILKSFEAFAKFGSVDAAGASSSSSKTFRLQFPQPFITDQEIFDAFKEQIAEPANPRIEKEKNITAEELKGLRDPEGLRYLLIESEQVQKMLAGYREQTSSMRRTQSAFHFFAQSLKKTLQEKQGATLEHLEVTVVYVDKKDLSQEIRKTFKAPLLPAKNLVEPVASSSYFSQIKKWILG